MTIQPTDLFLVSNGGSKKCEAQNLSSKTGNVLVNRGGSSFRTTIAEIPTKVLDDDLMLVNRDGVSFKATGAEVKQLFDTGTVGVASIAGPGSVYTNEYNSFTCNTVGNTVDDLAYQWSSPGGVIQSPNTQVTNMYWSSTGSKSITCIVSSPTAADTSTANYTTSAIVRPPAIGDYIPAEGGYWGGVINGQKIIIPTKNGSETMQQWRTQPGATTETGTDIRDDGSIFTNNYKNNSSYPAASWHGPLIGVNVNAVGGKTDWYLPALLEIQQIQLYFNPLTTSYAAFKAGASEAYLYGSHPYYPGNNTYYWTSSNDYNNPRVVGIRMDTGATAQVPCDEADWTPFVRPIRRGSAVLKSEEGAVEEANRLVRISTAKAVAKAAAKAVVEAVEAKKESQLNDEKESTEGS